MSVTTSPAWPPRGAMILGSWQHHSRSAPFWPALLLALALHGLLIFALGFRAPELPRASGHTLEVLVLRQPPDSTRPPPPATEALAQANQEAIGTGSETSATDLRPTERGAEPSNLPAPPLPSEPSPLPGMAETVSPSGPAILEVPPASMPDAASVTATLPEPLAAKPPLGIEREAEPDRQPAIPTDLAQVPKRSVAEILASRGQEIAKLNAKIEEDTAAYASRPRRKAISASTQEYKYASYLEAWRRKVEAIGNLNYPEEARRRQLFGNLILRVALRADGTLEEIRILRSSGSDVLDQAAMRIVNLAAPYAPFPPDIRQETDILDITSTWQFLSNNRFGEKR